MEHKRRAHADQRGSRVQQGIFDAASAQQPDDERQQRKDIADLIGAAGDKGQHRAQHSPAAVPCPLPRKQAEPSRHSPEQRPLRYGVVAVHALVPDGGRGQRQRKAAQRQRIPAAQSGRHAADSEGRRAGPGNDVEPVVRQAGVKQQVDGVRVMERKKQRRDEELLQKIILRVKELRHMHDHQSQEQLAEATELSIAQLESGKNFPNHPTGDEAVLRNKPLLSF